MFISDWRDPVLFNKWFLYKIIGDKGDVVFSIAYLFVYILIYMILCSWFDISIERVQRKPKMNCSLLICQVQNRETFMDVKELVKNCKYTECYTLMKIIRRDCLQNSSGS